MITACHFQMHADYIHGYCTESIYSKCLLRISFTTLVYSRTCVSDYLYIPWHVIFHPYMTTLWHRNWTKHLLTCEMFQNLIHLDWGVIWKQQNIYRRQWCINNNSSNNNSGSNSKRCSGLQCMGCVRVMYELWVTSIGGLQHQQCTWTITLLTTFLWL